MKGFSISGRFITAVLLTVSFISLSGCFQYPEGPIFTLETKDERFQGNWLIDQVTDPNGNDVTTQFSNITLFVQVSRDSKNLSYFKNGILDSFGTYEFADNNNDLIIIYTEYNGVDVSKEVKQIFYSIRRLTDNWVYYIDDKGYEFHYRKN